MRRIDAVQLLNLIHRRTRAALVNNQGEVHYERTRRTDRKGVETQTTSGTPLVWSREFGIAPVDDEWPYTADGRTVVRVDTTSFDARTGEVMERVRYTLVPSTQHPDSVRTMVFQTDEERRVAHLTAKRDSLVRGFPGIAVPDYITLSLELREARDIPALPPRALIGSAITAWGRSDHLSERRASEEAAIRAERACLRAQVENRLSALGARDFRAQASLYSNRLRVDVPFSSIGEALSDPDVTDFTVVAREKSKDEHEYLTQDLTQSFICTGLPNRFVAGIDGSLCSSTGVLAYMDSLNQATLVFPYLHMGYTGTGSTAAGGLAPWADAPDSLGGSSTPHLVLGFVSSPPADIYPMHPAFLNFWGEPRIRYMTTGLEDLGRLTTDIASVPAGPSNHGMRVLAIAMGDITDNQDSRFASSRDAEGARSGVARGAWAFASLTGGLDLFNLISSTGVDGVDIAFHTTTTNANIFACGTDGLCWPQSPRGSGMDQCPSPDQTRGLDDESQAIVNAYLYDSIVTFKSAGNLGGFNLSRCLGDDWTGVASEVGAPGTSPAAIAVGGTSSKTFTPFQIFRTASRTSVSSGGPTGDGRMYPHIKTPAWQCGAASRTETSTTDRYGDMGATSGATPRAAGSALLFKHWYLHKHPEVANSPGRIIANVLNMGDGKVQDGSGAGTTAPANGHGVGKLILRLFERGHMGGSWFRGTTAMLFNAGSPMQVVDLGGGSPLPTNLRSLRVTLWWLEVNTGEGEAQPDMYCILFNSRNVWFPTEGSRVPLLRFQFECASAIYDAPPNDQVFLLVYFRTTPEEARYMRRASRTVYVSWFWETEASPDDFTVLCATPVVCPVASAWDQSGQTASPLSAGEIVARLDAVDATTLDQFSEYIGEKLF